ncbi:hypothetical protein GIW81_00770 [Hyphomicrobium sp. xq]|uniref:Uncharacterized protein n=1 Tax=Hyphomicrobium album TaxID=2665159 RepID=A0A6I3KFT5_9HYPH|nr:hypothetical protein [Hyphomicrobium album]MTD92860.1 hypothetical protein [Hyphomicrobium album]
MRTLESLRAELLDLRAIRGLIARGWCQGTYAETRDRAERGNYRHATAYAWCLAGASFATDADICVDDRLRALIREDTACDGMVDWNDDPHRTQGEVLALIRRAESEVEDEIAALWWQRLIRPWTWFRT